jgi:hypothetical protein
MAPAVEHLRPRGYPGALIGLLVTLLLDSSVRFARVRCTYLSCTQRTPASQQRSVDGFVRSVSGVLIGLLAKWSARRGPPSLEIWVYQDRSKNFITAAQGVDMVLGGLHAGLGSALFRGVDYAAYAHDSGGVRAVDYNAVVRAHNSLVRQVARLEQLVEMRDAEIDILRRRMVRK